MHLVCYPYCSFVYFLALPCHPYFRVCAIFCYTRYCCFFCETLIGPNHHEGSSRNMLNLEFGVSDVRSIPSRDCSAYRRVPDLINQVDVDGVHTVRAFWACTNWFKMASYSEPSNRMHWKCLRRIFGAAIKMKISQIFAILNGVDLRAN